VGLLSFAYRWPHFSLSAALGTMQETAAALDRETTEKRTLVLVCLFFWPWFFSL